MTLSIWYYHMWVSVGFPVGSLGLGIPTEILWEWDGDGY